METKMSGTLIDGDLRRRGYNVVEQVRTEVDRQLELWGEQHWPDGTAFPHAKTYADSARNRCNMAAVAGKVTWRDILDEEIAEAYAEDDLEKLSRELVQVAAVAVSWVRDIKQRRTND